MNFFIKTPLATSVASALLMISSAANAQQDIDEIVVVGSQIRGAQITDALPVSVMNAIDIEALGVNSGDELLEFMAEQGQNFFSESENISGGVNSARGDIGAFNLRNLGTGNTLVLLNGRRVVNSAAYQTEAVGGSAACVVFASLYGESPVGNSYRYFGAVSESDAAFLQEVAQDVVMQFYNRE